MTINCGGWRRWVGPSAIRPARGLAGAALAATLAVSACSSASSASGGSSGTSGTSGGSSSGASTPAASSFLPSSLTGSAPSTVKIGLGGGYSIQFLPAILAMGAGYYQQVADRFHTSISFDVYPSGTPAQAAFFGGTDQFDVLGVVSQLAAVGQGEDQVALVNQSLGIGIPVYAPIKYQSSRGTDIAKFNSPTWCQIAPGGPSHAAAVLLAALNHLDISKLGLTTLGGVSAEVPSIQAGRCDLLAGTPNSAAVADATGASYIVQNTITPQGSIPLAGQVLCVSLMSSNKFIGQYPQLSQAITDATLKALLFIQQNISAPQTIYNLLPAGMKGTISEKDFASLLQLAGGTFAPKYTSGGFTVQSISDSVLFEKSIGEISESTSINPSKAFNNKLVNQAYKDLGASVPAGSPVGPDTLPSSVGLPTEQAAKAFATLTGGKVPANSGPSALN
jgi:ABC-type nitrate/sulfonate/bicarbonate transport system substrate-binding protein